VSACQSRGLQACYLGSGQHDATVAPAAWRGEYQLVYITPELAAHNADRIKALQASQVNMLRRMRTLDRMCRRGTVSLKTSFHDGRDCALWRWMRRIASRNGVTTSVQR
jgi:superfamily II DNA helicase RecQ